MRAPNPPQGVEQTWRGSCRDHQSRVAVNLQGQVSYSTLYLFHLAQYLDRAYGLTRTELSVPRLEMALTARALGTAGAVALFESTLLLQK